MSDTRESRNSVFTSQQGDPRIPSVSMADRVKADFGLDVPTEIVPLPSAGLVYPESSPLHSQDIIEIRSMTAREEDILMNRAFIKKGTAITELIKSCIVDKRIDVSDMLIGDRNALMVAIRITGYGPQYDVEMECPDCESKTKHSFNLADLPIKRLEVKPTEVGSNEFDFALPASGKVVKFKFLTGRDEEEMNITNERLKKQNLGGDNSLVTNSLLQSIISIDGVTDRLKVSNFIKMMPARDSHALRKFIRDAEPGIIMKSHATCDSCGRSEEVPMPMGVSFFWPDT